LGVIEEIVHMTHDETEREGVKETALGAGGSLIHESHSNAYRTLIH
jgi:hypothetical protein